MKRRLAVWVIVVALVVLATRTIAYALAPQSVLLAALVRGEGGPQVAGALIAFALLGAGVAIAALWLAVVAVRERLALEGRRLVETPRLRPLLLAGRMAGLFLTASFVFAMTESYIHWREGLGWHGLHCLVGPVHRDAIPILAALSLVAVAVHGAIEHLLAWARRLVAQLAARLPVLRGASPVAPRLALPHPAGAASANGARGPPARAVLVSVPSS